MAKARIRVHSSPSRKFQPNYPYGPNPTTKPTVGVKAAPNQRSMPIK